jgi:predicted nucleic acid-binding protein
MADGKAKGRPRSALDTIIVATAEAHECIVVTDNERNFDGFRVVVNGRSAE